MASSNQQEEVIFLEDEALEIYMGPKNLEDKKYDLPEPMKDDSVKIEILEPTRLEPIKEEATEFEPMKDDPSGITQKEINDEEMDALSQVDDKEVEIYWEDYGDEEETSHQPDDIYQ